MSAVRPHIVVLDDTERALQRLADWRAIEAQVKVTVHHEPLSGAALIEALKDADAIVLMRGRTPARRTGRPAPGPDRPG